MWITCGFNGKSGCFEYVDGFRDPIKSIAYKCSNLMYEKLEISIPEADLLFPYINEMT